MTITGGGDELLHPGVAAQRLGIATRTLADWADAGIVAVIRVGGGHRRYRAADIDSLTTSTDHTVPVGSPAPAARGPIGQSRGSYLRRGRALTDAEVAALAAATTVQVWAELAISYQADGSSIRQIAACTGTLPATVAARITRHSKAIEHSG